MKQNTNPVTLFSTEGAIIDGNLFKAKWEFVILKLEVLLKWHFYYENLFSNFLRSCSYEVLWIASCERLYNKASLSKVNKESNFQVPTKYLFWKDSEIAIHRRSTKNLLLKISENSQESLLNAVAGELIEILRTSFLQNSFRLKN